MTSPQSSFLRSLRGELIQSLEPEMNLTLKVAVLSAAGRTRAQMVRQLGASEVEVKMALLRLQRVAEQWN